MHEPPGERRLAGREGVHEARYSRAFLGHRDEEFARLAVFVGGCSFEAAEENFTTAASLTEVFTNNVRVAVLAFAAREGARAIKNAAK